MKLILASSSPRRKELLEQVHIPFQIKQSNFDESIILEKNPRKLVELLAKNKGREVKINENEVVLSADTVVAFQNKVLTKPHDYQGAFNMLKALNGQKHQVFTGVMIRSLEKEVLFSTCTNVEFWDTSEEVLMAYVDTGDPFDKAGGYGIQTAGALLVKQIEGDFYSVVGLPISRVVQELKAFQIYPFGSR